MIALERSNQWTEVPTQSNIGKVLTFLSKFKIEFENSANFPVKFLFGVGERFQFYKTLPRLLPLQHRSPEDQIAVSFPRLAG